MILEPLKGKAALACQYPAWATIIAFDGSVRSSKTITSLLAWVHYVLKGPKGNLAMFGRTETAVINNLIQPLQDMLGPKRVVINRGLGQVTILGRVVAIYGANDESARTKIQGLTLAGAYLDEATNVPESFFNMLRSRLSIPGAKLFLTCNPEGPKHWLLTKWLKRSRLWIDAGGRHHNLDPLDAKTLSIFRVTFVLPDNTYQMENNPEFVAEIERSFSGMWHRRYILGEWVNANGAIYEQWDEDRHTILSSEIPPDVEILNIALDYGTLHDTRAYALGMTRVGLGPSGTPDWAGTRAGRQFDRYRYVLIVLDEFAPQTGTIGQHADAFEVFAQKIADQYEEATWLAIDPAAAVFKREMYDRGYSNVINAHNRVLSGIQTVASLLTLGALYVVRDLCPHLCERIPGYVWDAKAAARGDTKPVKENDDEMDAFRYAVYTSRSTWRAHISLAMSGATSDEYNTEDEETADARTTRRQVALAPA